MVIQFLKNVVYIVNTILMLVFSLIALPFMICQNLDDKFWGHGWSRAFWRKD